MVVPVRLPRLDRSQPDDGAPPGAGGARRVRRDGSTVRGMPSVTSAELPPIELGPRDLDDRVHDAYLLLVDLIRRGAVREPERLMGFIRTVVLRRIIAAIHEAKFGTRVT